MSWRRPTGNVWGGGIAIAVATILAETLSACGVGPHRTLDARSVASEITSEVVSQYQLPARIVSVRCPSGIPVVAGQRFVCMATLAEQPLSINGMVTSSTGRYTVVPAEAVIVVAHAVTVLQAGIAAQLHMPVPVSCGTEPVLVRAPGDSFRCVATVQGHPRQVTVVVVNLQGRVSYTLAPSASTPSTLPGD